MKKLMVIAAVIAAFGLGTAAAFAAGSDKPPSPPGQDECEHGNSQKPCKEDPQPEHGADCEEHGNQGGVNEDHCKEGETIPTETVPTTPTTETETTETTPAETTSTETNAGQTTTAETTPAETTPAETTPADPGEEQQEQVSTPAQETTAAQSQSAAVGGAESATGPSKAAQPAPFTP
jgi:hypothetical protein